MSDKPTSDKPKVAPRTSKITALLTVSEAGYYIHFDHAGAQLGSTSPVHVKHGDLVAYRDLLTFGIEEWQRAKDIEKAANKVEVTS